MVVASETAVAALPRAQQARMATEEKRLLALKAAKTTRAEQLRQFRLAGVDAQFEAERRQLTRGAHTARAKWIPGAR